MNKNEKIGVLLLITLTLTTTLTCTIYLFEPVEHHVKSPQKYVDLESFTTYYKATGGTYTYTEVFNRIGTFYEYYEFKTTDYITLDYDADIIIQSALNSLKEGGRVYFQGPFRVTRTINVTHSDTRLEGGVFYGDAIPKIGCMNVTDVWLSDMTFIAPEYEAWFEENYPEYVDGDGPQ